MKRFTQIFGDTRQFGMILALVVMICLFEILTHGLLLQPQNVINLFQGNSYILVLAVGMVLVSGVWLTYREVGAWGQFVTTPFGRFLLAKIVLVVGLVAAGAYNQLVLMPKIARAQRAGRVSNVFAYVLVTFPRVVLTEVVLGIGVLAIVPFLNGSARSQAVGHEVEGPVMDGRLFSAGLLLVATLAASFYATAKASDGLGRRDLMGEGVAARS